MNVAYRGKIQPGQFQQMVHGYIDSSRHQIQPGIKNAHQIKSVPPGWRLSHCDPKIEVIFSKQ